MNDKERSEKLLGVLKRHNAEVNSIVEDWRESQRVVCKDQEVRIEGFYGGDVAIKFCRDGEHTQVEIWTKGVRRGYFHITEEYFSFYRLSSDFEGKVHPLITKRG